MGVSKVQAWTVGPVEATTTAWEIFRHSPYCSKRLVVESAQTKHPKVNLMRIDLLSSLVAAKTDYFSHALVKVPENASRLRHVARHRVHSVRLRTV